MNADKHIEDILRQYDEDFRSSVWRVQGNAVIYHKAVERIAAKAGIVFDPPTILRAERDEAVILVHGEMKGRRDWDIGECLVGVNYRVSGKQAAYVYAMAMKRARDRLVLKLIGLQGFLCSEDEADDFKGRDDARPNGAEPAGPAAQNRAGAPARPVGAEPAGPTAAPAKARRPLAPITVNGEQVEPEKSAYQARKDGDWPAFMDDLKKYSGDTDTLIRWVPSRLASLQRHPWYNDSLKEWRGALVDALAQECQSDGELDAWQDAAEGKLTKLPLDWRLAASGALEDARHNFEDAAERQKDAEASQGMPA